MPRRPRHGVTAEWTLAFVIRPHAPVKGQQWTMTWLLSSYLEAHDLLTSPKDSQHSKWVILHSSFGMNVLDPPVAV